MKARIYLSFNIERPSWLALEKLLKEHERQSIVIVEPFSKPLFSSYCAIRLNEIDPTLQRLRTELLSASIEWSERREYVFTNAELEVAPLLQLRVQTAQRGRSGPHYGTDYDLSHACLNCGTGAIQISPLCLRPSDAPKKRSVFQTLENEKLVSLELADALKDVSVTGLELRQVQSHKDRSPLPWVQLIASVELPPMAATSKGVVRDEICPLCRRSGYFDTQAPSEIEYSSDKVDIDNLPDAVHTYEYFGYSWLKVPFENSILARPLLLVKPKVFKVFQMQKVRGVEFVPVRIS